MPANQPAGNEAAEKKTEKKGIFAVLQNLRHNGKHYGKGSTVQLTGKEAKGLLDRKVVAMPAPKAAALASEETASE